MEVGRVDIVLGGRAEQLEAAAKRGERALKHLGKEAQSAARRTEKGVEQARREVDKLGTTTEQSSRRQRRSHDEAGDAVARLTKRYREQQRVVRETIAVEEARARALRQSALVGETATQAQLRQSAATLAARGATDAQVAAFVRAQRQAATYQAAIGGASLSVGQMSLAAGGALAAVYGLQRGLDAAIGPAIAYQSSFTGVRKTVNATEDELAQLATEIRDLASQDLPVAVNQLNAIGEAAGQLGISTPGIAKFVDTVARLGVSTDLSFDQAAFELAQFRNITQLSEDDVDRLGSTIVALGNSTATTESRILGMSLRIAGAGRTVGLADADILALGASLSSLGIEAEAGGSAISRLLVETAKAVRSSTKELGTFASVAGVSVGRFSELFERDAVEALDVFVKGLRQIEDEGGNSLQILEELGLEDVRLRDAVLRLASGQDVLTDALRTSRQAFAENNALAEESRRRFEDAEQRAQLLANKIEDLRITIGERALPAYVALVDKTGELVDKHGELIAQNVGGWFESIALGANSIVDVFDDVLSAYNRLPSFLQEALAAGASATATGGGYAGFFRGVGRRITDRLPGSGDPGGPFDPSEPDFPGQVLAGSREDETLARIFAANDQREAARAMLERFAGATGPTKVFQARRRPTAPPHSGGGGGKSKGPSPQESLLAIAGEYAGILDAQQKRLLDQARALEQIGDKTGAVAVLEEEALGWRKQSLEFQVAALKSVGEYGAELANLEAELAGVNLELANATGPAMQVADEIERAAAASSRFDTELRLGVLDTVEQIVAGIAQGTTELKDFPKRLLEASIGNFVSDGFGLIGGLFTPGTGAGLGVGGLIGGNAPPAGFTGPPVNRFGATTRGLTGALQTAGGFFSGLGPEGLINGALGIGALGGSLASKGVFGAKAENNSSLFGLATSAALLAPFTFGLAPLGLALLGSRAPSAKERRRMAVGEGFRESNLFPTLAFAKNPPREFADAEPPAFIGGLSNEIGALSLLLGGTLEDARTRLPRTVGQRASVAGLGLDRVRKELRTVAADSGVSLDDAVFDLTDRFLRYQQEGKGAAIDQREYNDLLEGTVELFAEDLPGGVRVYASALETLEQFGDNQIANLDRLNEAIAETRTGAATLAAGIADGLRAAADSGNILDASQALASRFGDAFLDQLTTDLIESEIFADSLSEAISLYREASAALRAGDAERAAVLQAQLSNVFAQTNATLLQETAPLAQLLRGFQSSIGVQTAPGIIRQQQVIQLQLDGRTLAEVQVSNERLQRSGGVIAPEQIGTR